MLLLLVGLLAIALADRPAPRIERRLLRRRTRLRPRARRLDARPRGWFARCLARSCPEREGPARRARPSRFPVDVAWIRASRMAFGGIPGAYLPFADQMLVLLVSRHCRRRRCSGLVFRWAAERAAAEGHSLARSYAIESAGSCLGASSATLAFVSGVPTWTAAVCAAGPVPRCSDGLLAGRALLRRSPGSPRSSGSRRWPRLRAASRPRHDGMVAPRRRRITRLPLRAHHGNPGRFPDGIVPRRRAGLRERVGTPEELAHLAALAHPAPRRILVLGGSVRGTSHELSKHAPERLVTVELDGEYAAMGRRLARRVTGREWPTPGNSSGRNLPGGTWSSSPRRSPRPDRRTASTRASSSTTAGCGSGPAACWR